MNTALTTTTIPTVDRPSHKQAIVQTHATLPRPPKICDTLNAAVPPMYTGQDRIKYLAGELAGVKEDDWSCGYISSSSPNT
jgi:hypothetical protein